MIKENEKGFSIQNKNFYVHNSKLNLESKMINKGLRYTFVSLSCLLLRGNLSIGSALEATEVQTIITDYEDFTLTYCFSKYLKAEMK